MPSFVDPNITTQQMKAVLTIARCRSFVAAAEELSVSQSSLTRIIQSLEEHLGTKLFARSTRRVDLTPDGEEFIGVADRVLNDLGIFYSRMRDAADQKRGQIVVSTLMSVAQGLLPSIIASYRKEYPAIEIHIREGMEQEIEEDIRSGICDFAIASIDGPSDTLLTMPLLREMYEVVLRQDHPLAALDQVPLKKILGSELISLPVGSRTRQVVEGAAAASGMPVGQPMTTGQLATIYAMVRSGVGIAILPQGFVKALGGTDVVSRPISRPPLYRDLSIIYLAGRPLSAAANGLVELIKSSQLSE